MKICCIFEKLISDIRQNYNPIVLRKYSTKSKNMLLNQLFNIDIKYKF
jgi:hypothetical protein